MNVWPVSIWEQAFFVIFVAEPLSCIFCINMGFVMELIFEPKLKSISNRAIPPGLLFLSSSLWLPSGNSYRIAYATTIVNATIRWGRKSFISKL